MTSLEVMGAFHSTKFSKISDGNRMELSGKDFQKFKTTFSVSKILVFLSKASSGTVLQSPSVHD